MTPNKTTEQPNGMRPWMGRKTIPVLPKEDAGKFFLGYDCFNEEYSIVYWNSSTRIWQPDSGIGEAMFMTHYQPLPASPKKTTT